MKKYIGPKFYGHKNYRIAVGLGEASLRCDGEIVYSPHPMCSYEESMTFDKARKIAKTQPDSVWEIHLIGPLSEQYYRLEGDKRKRWVLFATGRGFA